MNICDRCGKEFTPQGGTHIRAVIVYPDIDISVLNLCPECQEGLRVWIEKGDNNVSEA